MEKVQTSQELTVNEYFNLFCARLFLLECTADARSTDRGTTSALKHKTLAWNAVVAVIGLLCNNGVILRQPQDGVIRLTLRKEKNTTRSDLEVMEGFHNRTQDVTTQDAWWHISGAINNSSIKENFTSLYESLMKLWKARQLSSCSCEAAAPGVKQP